ARDRGRLRGHQTRLGAGQLQLLHRRGHLRAHPRRGRARRRAGMAAAAPLRVRARHRAVAARRRGRHAAAVAARRQLRGRPTAVPHPPPHARRLRLRPLPRAGAGPARRRARAVPAAAAGDLAGLRGAPLVPAAPGDLLTTSPTVRPVTLADLPALHATCRAAELADRVPYATPLDELELELTDEGLDLAADSVGWFAADGSCLAVGWVHLSPEPSTQARWATVTATVHPDHPRRGIGPALVARPV